MVGQMVSILRFLQKPVEGGMGDLYRDHDTRLHFPNMAEIQGHRALLSLLIFLGLFGNVFGQSGNGGWITILDEDFSDFETCSDPASCTEPYWEMTGSPTWGVVEYEADETSKGGIAESFIGDDESAVKKHAKTILIIDDEPETCKLISDFLKESGYDTVIATDGRKGIELAEQIKPFAITLDVIMPEMDGWETLRRLKASNKTADIPVIVISVSDDKTTGAALGASGTSST